MANASEPKAATELPLCFVISPIGAEGSEVRNTADKVLKHVIAKALSGKYKIKRADEIAKPGLITAQIVERLLDAPLVVADLSDGNENVYYELAIRHAANKPVIHIIADGQDAPFDVKDMRFISYDLKDPDSVDKAQEKIRAQATAIEQGDKFLTPVQVAQILAQPSTGGSEGSEVSRKLFEAVYNAIASLQQEVRETKAGVRMLLTPTPGISPFQPLPTPLFGGGGEGVTLSPMTEKGFLMPSNVSAQRLGEKPPSKDSPAGKKK